MMLLRKKQLIHLSHLELAIYNYFDPNTNN